MCCDHSAALHTSPAVVLPVVSAHCEPLTNTPPVSQMWQQVSTPGGPLDHRCPGPSPALGCGPATHVLLFLPFGKAAL